MRTLQASVINCNPQFDLFEPEPAYYHRLVGPGYFAVLTRKSGECAAAVQSSYRLTQMPAVLDALPRDRDSWISQAEFFRPNRRLVNLARIGLLFADLDTYKVPALARRSPDELVHALLLVCDDQDIPPPSLVVFSGRGLQAKWLLDAPLPRQALPRWNACQRYLVERLEALGADTAARDASRVLRLVKTVNSRSGEIVRVCHVTEDQGHPVRYSFEYLAECLLPFTRDQLAEVRRARLSVVEGGRITDGLRKFNGRRLAWDRLEDLRTLVRLRGGVTEGQRMITLHWHLNFLMLSGVTHSSQMYYEAQALAREIAPEWRYGPPELGSLYRKAQAMEAGQWVEWNGRKYPPLYTPRNDTLINIFQITDAEQQHLRTIISKSVARKRHAERERARRIEAGAVSRQTYLNQAQDKRAQARLLRAKGLTVREIAREIGASIGAVSGYLKEA